MTEPGLLWMDKILHHLETMVETIVGWYLQGTHPNPGFLRWCVGWISQRSTVWSMFRGVTFFVPGPSARRRLPFSYKHPGEAHLSDVFFFFSHASTPSASK